MLTADGVLGLVSRWFPYRQWYSMITSGTTDEADYWFICYDCFGYIEVGADLPSFTGINALVASIPILSTAN